MQEANLDLISAHPRKQRAKFFGEVIQMDASLEIWFGCVKFTLLLAVDEATGRIVAAIFRPQETLEGYYTITKQFLEKYGVPVKMITDRRTVFTYKKRTTPGTVMLLLNMDTSAKMLVSNCILLAFLKGKH